MSQWPKTLYCLSRYQRQEEEKLIIIGETKDGKLLAKFGISGFA